MHGVKTFELQVNTAHVILLTLVFRPVDDFSFHSQTVNAPFLYNQIPSYPANLTLVLLLFLIVFLV